jgi:hypothetical protein
MTHVYEAFGARVSSNRPLAALRETAAGSSPDIVVEFAEGRAPQVDDRAAQTTASTGSHSALRAGDGGWLYRLASHAGERAWSMHVSGDGGRIEVRWRGAVEIADVGALVEVSGLPAALSLRGVPLLHGCAFDAGGSALVVLGPSGAGKSTVAAAAVAAGRALLADDIVALAGSGPELRVHPGGHQLRMNADTARALGWDPAELGRVYVTPAMPPKRFLRLSVADGSLCAGPTRVAALFVLGPRRAGEPAIERLAPAAALPVLLRNTYGDHALDDGARARLLRFWARLAREVPVYTVTPPDGLHAVPALVDALAAAMLPQPCDRPSSSSGLRAP